MIYPCVKEQSDIVSTKVICVQLLSPLFRSRIRKVENVLGSELVKIIFVAASTASSARLWHFYLVFSR